MECGQSTFASSDWNADGQLDLSEYINLLVRQVEQQHDCGLNLNNDILQDSCRFHLLKQINETNSSTITLYDTTNVNTLCSLLQEHVDKICSSIHLYQLPVSPGPGEIMLPDRYLDSGESGLSNKNHVGTMASLIVLFFILTIGIIVAWFYVRRSRRNIASSCIKPKESSTKSELYGSETDTETDDTDRNNDSSSTIIIRSIRRNSSLLSTLDRVERGLKNDCNYPESDESANDTSSDYFSTKEEEEEDEVSSTNSQNIEIYEAEDETDEDLKYETGSVAINRIIVTRESSVEDDKVQQEAWTEFQLRNSQFQEDDKASIYKLWSASSLHDNSTTATTKRWTLSAKPMTQPEQILKEKGFYSKDIVHVSSKPRETYVRVLI